MLQIIGYLLCVYLIVKGFEFLHRSACAPKDASGAHWATAALMFLGCCAAAVVFFFWFTAQGSQPGPPRLLVPRFLHR